MTHDGAVERLQGHRGLSRDVRQSVRHGGDQYRPHGQGDRQFRAHRAQRQRALRSLQERRQERDDGGQVRGMDVFFDKAKCDRCHEGSNFTLNAYSNLGVGTDKPEPDVGRFAVTQRSARLGRLQDADAARDRAHRAVHARRQLEDAGRSGGLLRQGRHSEQESGRQHQEAAPHGRREEGPGGVSEGTQRRRAGSR